ncbi:potassium/sodium hyperpolarization-activated cyclic nucleotide-gated channel 4 isoform X3 [Cylas formicarius]|uniref:potassium/sodium hyperpolarization-activated cyclic nucleotide-gated channel 4 isoform X3 n=1 Tax=Cylas formicarius TaxID=197179 RepID=UPI002958DC3F|nr:potassium/sodium hyperpolarization-activated cyclic nucleotide-gated channel 4 isoform X3 [Cylas formicarius]
MKLSVSAYRAHASAHKKILDTSYNLNYGSTSASHLHPSGSGSSVGASGFQIDPPTTNPTSCGVGQIAGTSGAQNGSHLMVSGGHGGEEGSSDDANTPLHSPRSHNTSRDEDESSNANESDCKSPSQRTKSNQRWMKLRTTVQISSAISAKKPPLKREDSFLKRFSSRQIPEAQETVEDTGSEGAAGDNRSAQRRRRRKLRQPRTVVNPDSNFYFYWLFVLTICVLYNLWTLIVRQSFPELQEMISTFWLTCDSISDLVFVLDLAVQFRTGYLEQGLMVYDSKKLACHYLRSRAFLLDLTALCPVDLLQFRFGPNPLLRCPRFLKVYRAVNYYYMVESRTIWPNLWRVVNLIHILLILAHWFGCFYFLLSEAEGFQGDWVYPYRPGDYATLTRKYLGSLYWSTLTLTTIGDLPTPETNAEKTDSVDGPRSLPRRGVKSRLLQFSTSNGYIFTIVSYLIGVFIFATIVGQVGNVITNRNANRLEFERLLDGAKTYMRHHKVPGGMKRRVLRWYDYSWSRGRIQGGGDINTALGLLPDKLKTELALHVNLSVLKKVTIFQECQPEFLRDLVLKMKAYIFTPGDSICRKGEVAREMFIIADGILEVISETGKVLTTMKAGDFFGEIGILNLDGLNKRTADVRSVGYSELFSLSREDVLAAMKDYPEAQEILQALGRKRLMEYSLVHLSLHGQLLQVKASAKHPPHHKGEHHHASHHLDNKGLVDKIKSEAKGLKNVLRKSRTHRRSEESLELQPLQGNGNNGAAKGPLKRMSRVKSHDLSQEHDNGDKKEIREHTGAPEVSPLGAGLPLLQRLRLLKEKQENEERYKTSTPPVLSPQSSNVRSPPPIIEETSLNDEPIGAGLPLLQRILMLKAKEEKAAKVVKTAVGAGIFGTIKGPPSSQPTSPTPIAAPSSTTARASFSGPAKTTLASVPAKLLNNKISFRDRIKLHTNVKEKDSSIKDSLLNDSEPPALVDPSNIVPKVPSSILSSDRLASNVVADEGSEAQNISERLAIATSFSESVEKNGAHWSKLKRAAISKDALLPDGSSRDQENGNSQTEVKDKAVKKPSFVLSRKTKHYRFVQSKFQKLNRSVPTRQTQTITSRYRSIDDLSPEYGPLPFVKKLKILNERQKLEELEIAMKTRSFSLDIPDTQIETTDTLTRSHSEGSAVHQDQRRQEKQFLCAPLAPSPLHSSNESNETPERRNLKSILKKLSEDTKEKEPKENETNTHESKDSSDFKKLMRAPTIEGYAARHSKLAKSVTFNRDTLQSPPHSANAVLGTPQSLFPFINSPTDNGLDVRQEEKKHELERCGIQLVPNRQNNQVKLLKASLEDEQQYFADILLAIKQVISTHLLDLQQKFQERFDRLEDELRRKSEVITQLKAHICELEKGTDDSFSGSLDTIITRDRHSWEEPTHEETEELQELPQPLDVWSPQSNDTVLNIDSATDTESDIGETSENEPTDYESGDQYENSSSNWEIELLAAQMRERRAASLDHSVGRPPLRNRFFKGSSVDAND